MKGFLLEVSKWFESLVQLFAHPSTTSGLFKATVLLGSAFLIGANEQGSFLYKEDVAAHKAKFEIEQKYGAGDLEKIDCSSKPEFQSMCLTAQY